MISYVAEIRKLYGPTTTSMNGPGNHFVNLFLLGKSVAPILLKSCCWYFDDAIQLYTPTTLILSSLLLYLSVTDLPEVLVI